MPAADPEKHKAVWFGYGTSRTGRIKKSRFRENSTSHRSAQAQLGASGRASGFHTASIGSAAYLRKHANVGVRHFARTEVAA
jgi:hypothetical protein